MHPDDREPVPLLRLGKTQHGKAVYADRPFLRGEFLLQFQGRVYTKAEYLAALRPDNCHFLQIGPDSFLGPTHHISDYVNHSCCPNTGVHIVAGRAFLFALRNLRRGEEITFDYSTTMAEDHWEMDCSCGSCVCRGRIRDFKHLPRRLKETYIRRNMIPAFVLEACKHETAVDGGSTEERSHQVATILAANSNRQNAHIRPTALGTHT